MNREALILSAVLAVAASPLGGQIPSTLAPGTRVRVTDTRGKRVTGVVGRDDHCGRLFAVPPPRRLGGVQRLLVAAFRLMPTVGGGFSLTASIPLGGR